MLKKVKLIFFGGILIVVAMVIFLIWQNSKAEPIALPTTQEDFSPPTQPRVQVETNTDQAAPVDNFYEDNVFTYPNGNTNIIETNDFQIAYLAQDKIFYITMYPFSPNGTREIAEKAFLDKLGITEQTACSLNVEVRHFKDTLRGPAEISLLSFCQ